MSWRHALRKAATSIQARTDAAPMLGIRLGTIATVTAGAASDGNAAVTVTIGGSTIAAPYLAAYTPVNGHTVLVLLVLRSPVILGRIIGQPSF